MPAHRMQVFFMSIQRTKAKVNNNKFVKIPVYTAITGDAILIGGEWSTFVRSKTPPKGAWQQICCAARRVVLPRRQPSNGHLSGSAWLAGRRNKKLKARKEQ